MNQSAITLRPVTVEIVNGQPTTTSLDVAEHFDKRHDNVIKAIRQLDCSPQFAVLNFKASEYADPTGRKLPMYRMTRDGFTFLCMGFTGAQAARWKEAYIEAFNRLESARGRQWPAPTPEIANAVTALADAIEAAAVEHAREVGQQVEAALTDRLTAMTARAKSAERRADKAEAELKGIRERVKAYAVRSRGASAGPVRTLLAPDTADRASFVAAFLRDEASSGAGTRHLRAAMTDAADWLTSA